uniref:Mitochondrial ribosomal protein S7 n=1 Tax=Cyprinus carpio carpio TaxID=630221 RepID=A0A9J8BZY7_CYPCA
MPASARHLLKPWTPMMQDGNKILARGIMTQTIKRKQVEKYHKSPAAKRRDRVQSTQRLPAGPGELQTHHRPGQCSERREILSDNRRRFLAMKWMITECRDNKHRRTHMYEKLSQELLAAFANEGNVVKRKYDLHKMAGANRAYAHYRWW